MKCVKVTKISGAYAFEGRSYGPFVASEDLPFVEVPEALARAVGMTLHESEQEKEQEQEGRSVDVQAILKANADLTQDLVAAQARIAELEAALSMRDSTDPPAKSAPKKAAT